jgi:DnaJ-domain-containing protein 1
VAPKTLKRWLIALAVVYLLFPRDLLVDFTGVGLIDDLLFAALLFWFYRRQVGKAPARERQQDPETPASASSFDPHQVLGVPASASADEVRSAYKARMSEYHPDKVAHLGQEMQELAHRKTLEIQQAYQKLRR